MSQAFNKYVFGTTAPSYAKANVSAAVTDSVIVAAIAGKKIRVVACAFVCGATATNATFNSGSTAISMLFANAANGGAVLGFNPVGWFETNAGEALTLTTSSGSTTGVQLVYVPI